MTGPTTAVRKVRLGWSVRRLIAQIENELSDDFLILLLDAMRLALAIDPAYHRNIEYGGDVFNATYVFKSKDGGVKVTARFEPVRILLFKRQRLRVRKGAAKTFDVEITFLNAKALWEFLLAEDPDVFAFILDNKLQTQGNLNYVMKFGYMANRLKHLTKLGTATA
jgi:hypothetical protein